MFVAKYAYMCDLRIEGEATQNCLLCLVCHLHHINEHPSPFKATNFWCAFIAFTQNNAWYYRSTNFVELEVNVPRTIGILRDGTLKHVHNNDNFIPSLFKVQYSGKEFNFKKCAYKTNSGWININMEVHCGVFSAGVFVVVDKGPKLLPVSVKVLEQVLLTQAANSCLEMWSIWLCTPGRTDQYQKWRKW